MSDYKKEFKDSLLGNEEPLFYTLDKDGEAVETSDPEWVWGTDRQLALAEMWDLSNPKDPQEIQVSTVFMVVAHGHKDGKPIVWETMVFGGAHDNYCERYCTLDEAVEGHDRIVKMVAEDL